MRPQPVEDVSSEPAPTQRVVTPTQGVVTPRALVVGLLGVLFICGLTPFNNFVLGNTYLVGNLLPVGVLLFVSVFVLLVNGALRALGANRWALTTGELAVVLTMTLASCALPSSGLMRWLPAHLVGFQNEAQQNANFAKALDAAPLADWIYPDFAKTRSAERGREPVVVEFVGRSVDGVVPWRAWVRPAIAWGTLTLLLYGALVGLLTIVRKQWQDNERLAFPLADVYATLLEDPGPGRAWPSVFRQPSFWIAAAAVFVVHGTGALSQYFPKVPAIPLGYNFNSLFSDPPLSYSTYGLKSAKLYFIVLGITYFAQARVSFSIVAFFLLYNLLQMTLGMAGQTIDEPRQRDQTLGVILVLALTILYVGRHHWMTVLRAMTRTSRPAEPTGDAFGSYALAGWGVVVCAIGAMIWLALAGASVIVAILTILGVLTLWLVMARLAAESGLIYAQLHNAPLSRSLTILTTDFGLPRPASSSFFASSLVGSLFVTDQRESPAVYTSSAMVASDRAVARRRLAGLVVCTLVALVVGFVVSGTTTLWCEYHFSSTMDLTQKSPLNVEGVSSHPKWYVLNPLVDFTGRNGGPRDTHWRPGHVLIGAAAAILISTLYLRFGSFPLHPIGLLLMYSYPVQNSWLGIALGWLCKSIITRLGGSKLYVAAKPVFLGLIFGEASAVALWLVVSALRAAMGLDYRAINLLAP